MPRRIAGSLFSGFVTQAALALSGILLARALGPGDRGYLALLFLWPTILFQLADVGLPIGGAYYISRNPVAAGAIAHSLVVPAVYQAFAIVLLHILVLSWFLPTRGPEVRLAGLLTLAVGPTLLIQDYVLAILQGQQRFATFNMLRTLTPLLNAAVAVAVWAGRLRLVPATLLLVVSYSVSGIAALIMLSSGLPRAHTLPETPSRRSMLQFGVRSFLGSLYPVENFRIDQVIVGIVLSPAALGLYVVSLAFTNFARFTAQSLGMVAYPHIASQATARLRRASSWKFFWGGVALSGAVVVILEVAVGPIIPWLFGEAFRQSVPLARILLVAGLLAAARRILAEALKGQGFPLPTTIAEVASWIAFAGSLALLVSPAGVTGVAISVVVAAACSLVILLIIDARWIGRDREPADLMNVRELNETQ